MSKIALARKYRPHNWEDVCEQNSIIKILQHQVVTGKLKNSYIFAGISGNGKTTVARIFADKINKGQGNPIEIDAASNNSIENTKEIINGANTLSLDSHYKVYIIDECQILSSASWQSLLKIIEEPPLRTVFIFCTTNPEKIPPTIQNRCQRYDFQRMSVSGIIARLDYIIQRETSEENNIILDDDVLPFLAKLANGGMRSAITMLDKCLSYSTELTLSNVVETLGVNSYDEMFLFLSCIISKDNKGIIKFINDIYFAGRDLNLFISQFLVFMVDILKYEQLNSFEYINIPNTFEAKLTELKSPNFLQILDMFLTLNYKLKYEANIKPLLEAELMVLCTRLGEV